MFRAFVARGAGGGAHDNAAIMRETVALRAERARLLGFPSFADFRLADTMAKTPHAALDLMRRVWAPARAAGAARSGGAAGDDRRRGRQFRAQAWDWRYYAEKRRKALYDVDQSEIGPYLPLEAMIAAAFDVAHRLFGVSFVARDDVRSAEPRRARLDGARPPTARRSRCSSATISPATRSTAAPG